MSMFKTLDQAESYLQAQGFRLVRDTCDWTNAAGADAGVFSIERGPYVRLTGFKIEITDGRNVEKLADYRR